MLFYCKLLELEKLSELMEIMLAVDPPFLLTHFSVAAPCACAYCSSQLHTLVLQRLSRSGYGILQDLPRQLAAVCPCAAAYPDCFNLAADFGGGCWHCSTCDRSLPTWWGSMCWVLVIADVFVISLIFVSSFLLTLSFLAVLWGGGHDKCVGAPAAHFQSSCVFIFLLPDGRGSWSVAQFDSHFQCYFASWFCCLERVLPNSLIKPPDLPFLKSTHFWDFF